MMNALQLQAKTLFSKNLDSRSDWLYPADGSGTGKPAGPRLRAAKKM